MPLPEAYSAVEDHITADWMQGAVEFCLRSERHFAEYLGVGPSTVTGWVKAKAYPDQVKRLLVFTMLDFMNKRGSKSELSMLRAKVADADRTEFLAADNF